MEATEPPVWSTLMATFLKRHGHSVHILDAEAESFGYDEAARHILEAGAVLTVFVVYGRHKQIEELRSRVRINLAH